MSVRTTPPRCLWKITSKSLDFAIMGADGVVVLAVELNDRTHDKPDRQQRDRFVKDALRQAGIPLATFRPGERINLAPFLRRQDGQQRPGTEPFASELSMLSKLRSP